MRRRGNPRQLRTELTFTTESKETSHATCSTARRAPMENPVAYDFHDDDVTQKKGAAVDKDRSARNCNDSNNNGTINKPTGDVAQAKNSDHAEKVSDETDQAQR